MALLVLFALFRAFLTDLGTILADQVDEFAFTSHEVYGKAADGRAIPIQRDTSRHELGVRLPLTGPGAMIAELGAFCTGFDTGLIRIVGHVDSLVKAPGTGLQPILANPLWTYCSLRHIAGIWVQRW